ncbi:S-layer homology domain-containing protein [Paenibacillus albiflavus]|nr:S-layer homology domain-containing protein [Paenibacillus albiflavus]
MRKGILILLMSVLLGTLSGVSQAEDTIKAKAFTDVKDSHWAKKDIIDAVEKGYVDGYPDETFNPEGTVTKAEFIKMAAAALKYKLSTDDSAWYSKYWNTAKEQKLIVNNDLSEQEVNKPITRFEMARVASRAIGETTTEENKWMYLATSNGLIHGHPGGLLAEEETTTRAQAVAVIERILSVKAGVKLPLDKYAISSAEIVWHKTNVLTMLPQYFAYDYNKVGTKFKDNLMRQEGKIGYSEVEKYVIVDMDDLNDPNRSLIPPNARWMYRDGSKITHRTDVPTNSYALFSVNHMVLDLEKDLDEFRFSRVEFFTDNFDFKSDKLKADGKPHEITMYAEYIENRGYLASSVRDLKKGHHDIRIVTGTLIPKGEFQVNKKSSITIYLEPSQELGFTGVDQLYSSKIDYSLSK